MRSSICSCCLPSAGVGPHPRHTVHHVRTQTPGPAGERIEMLQLMSVWHRTAAASLHLRSRCASCTSKPTPMPEQQGKRDSALYIAQLPGHNCVTSSNRIGCGLLCLQAAAEAHHMSTRQGASWRCIAASRLTHFLHMTYGGWSASQRATHEAYVCHHTEWLAGAAAGPASSCIS